MDYFFLFCLDSPSLPWIIFSFGSPPDLFPRYLCWIINFCLFFCFLPGPCFQFFPFLFFPWIFSFGLFFSLFSPTVTLIQRSCPHEIWTFCLPAYPCLDCSPLLGSDACCPHFVPAHLACFCSLINSFFHPLLNLCVLLPDSYVNKVLNVASHYLLYAEQ